jgi:diketogulonate reductase-like aldo/keto reductase
MTIWGLGIGQGIGNYHWDDTHIPVIREGIDREMTLLDTCENYGGGSSEITIGKAIRGLRDKVQILTKFDSRNSSYDDIMRSVEGSLKRLGTDYIDIYQSHWPATSGYMHEVVRAFDKLLSDGKVLSVGIGNPSYCSELEAAYILSDGKISSVQFEYNLFERSPEKLFFQYCLIRGIKTISYSPLFRNRIANGKTAVDTIKKMANKYDKTPQQVALNWLVRESRGCVIPRTKNKDHMIDNSESMSFYLSCDDIKEISDACNMDIEWVSPAEIDVVLDGEENRKVYQTLEEAKKNEFNCYPSPVELSKDLLGDDFIKPVKLLKSDSELRYKLVEGRIRYWAHVIGKGNRDIPAIVINRK